MIKRIHTILADPACRENIRCLNWTINLVGLYFCLAIFGMAWLNTSMDSQVPKLASDVQVLQVQVADQNNALRFLDNALIRLENKIMPSSFKGRK